MQYSRYLPGLIGRGIRPEIFSGTPKATKIWKEDREADWYRLAPGEPLPEASLGGAPLRGIRLPDDLGRRRTTVYFQNLLEYCSDSATRPDLLNLMMKLSPDSLPWVERLRRSGVPLVYSMTIAPLLSGWRIARFRKLRMLLRHYALFDCIIVQSVAHVRWLREIGYRNRIEVIPNGVDAAKYRPPMDADEQGRLRAKLGFADGEPIVTTVGAISQRKGTDVMIESLRGLRQRHPRARLVVIGWRGDEVGEDLRGFRKRMDELMSDPETARNVQFTGVVDNVEEYLRASDVFLFASNREGFPNALLEAMASGLPTVTTPFVGLAEDFGEPGREYLLVERNASALAEAVSEVLDKDPVRAELSSRGLQLVRESMRLDDSLDLFASLYQELARGTP